MSTILDKVLETYVAATDAIFDVAARHEAATSFYKMRNPEKSSRLRGNLEGQQGKEKRLKREVFEVPKFKRRRITFVPNILVIK